MATLPKATKATRFLTHNDLRARGIDFTMNSLMSLVDRGKFPKPVQLSQRKRVWVEEVINNWMREKIEK